MSVGRPAGPMLWSLLPNFLLLNVNVAAALFVCGMGNSCGYCCAVSKNTFVNKWYLQGDVNAFKVQKQSASYAYKILHQEITLLCRLSTWLFLQYVVPPVENIWQEENVG